MKHPGVPIPPQHLRDKMRYFFEHRMGRKLDDGADFILCDLHGAFEVIAHSLEVVYVDTHNGRNAYVPTAACPDCGESFLVQSHGTGRHMHEDEVLQADFIGPSDGARHTLSIDIDALALLTYARPEVVQTWMDNKMLTGEEPSAEDMEAELQRDDPESPPMHAATPVTWKDLHRGDADGKKGFKPWLEEMDIEADDNGGTKPGPPRRTSVGNNHREWDAPPPGQPLDDGPERHPELIARGRARGRVEHSQRKVKPIVGPPDRT